MGLGISIIVFVVEIIFHKITIRRAARVTQEAKEEERPITTETAPVDNFIVVKTVMDMEQEEKDKTKQSSHGEDEKDD